MTNPVNNPVKNMTYDVIVLSAGPAGENVADRVVQGGLSVAIVEAELVGGECSYWACMPTKALLRSGTALHAAQQLPGAREPITSSLDVKAILERRNGFTSRWKDDGQVSWLRSAGIGLVRGRGRLTSSRAVEVTDAQGQTTQLTARHAVVIPPDPTPSLRQCQGSPTCRCGRTAKPSRSRTCQAAWPSSEAA